MWKYIDMKDICVPDVLVILYLSLIELSDLVNSDRQHPCMEVGVKGVAGDML